MVEGSFFFGAVLSWLVTYLYLTHDTRLVARIRREISSLAVSHGLNKVQLQKADAPGKLASTEDVLHQYRRAAGYAKQSNLKLNPEILAAEVILCETILDLTFVHAVRILMRAKGKTNLMDVLREVSEELAHDERFTSSDDNDQIAISDHLRLNPVVGEKTISGLFT